MTVGPKPTTSGIFEASPAISKAEPKTMPANSKIAARPAIVQVPPPPITALADADPKQQSSSISHYFDLEIEARQCADLDALRFAIVNSTRKIASFEQAFLAEPAMTGEWCVTRASSVSRIDRNTPLVRALDAWLQHPGHAEVIQGGEPRLTSLEHDAREWGLRTKSFAFPHALWLPFKSRDGRILAALIALKTENWRPQHTALMMPLAGAYGHAWDALAPRTATSFESVKGYVSKRRVLGAATLACAIAAFIPVPMSVLAPSEIVAAEPMLVTAPIEGVIGDILAPPGAWVEKGAPIIRYVDVRFRNDVEVAARTRAVAQARHFKVVQSALATQKEMQELAIAKAELDVANAELEYAVELLERSTMHAERAGLLIYSAKSDWIGKPVSIGERLMEIGDPAKAEIKIELPVSDAIALQPGGAVSLFLDGDPLRSIDATISRTSFRPVLTAEQQLAFRIHARFSDGQPRRIGVRGVARVNGETVSLWFYLFRRPIAYVRQKVGL